MKKYNFITLFLLISSFAHSIGSFSLQDNVANFFANYTVKEEKILEPEAIKRDLRSSFMYYFALSAVVIFSNANQEDASIFFKIMFLVAPFISNFLAGILQRALSKNEFFRKRSRLIQNILFTLIGAGCIALLASRAEHRESSITSIFIMNSIVYGVTSVLIYLLEPSPNRSRRW